MTYVQKATMRRALKRAIADIKLEQSVYRVLDDTHVLYQHVVINGKDVTSKLALELREYEVLLRQLR